MLCKILVWNDLVQGFCVLGTFGLLLQFLWLLLVYSSFLLLLHSDLEDYIFMEICPFHLGFQISWHTVLCSNFFQPFVFLWYQLESLLFHFWLCLFRSSLFLLWWVCLKACRFRLSSQKTRSFIYWSLEFGFSLHVV